MNIDIIIADDDDSHRVSIIFPDIIITDIIMEIILYTYVNIYVCVLFVVRLVLYLQCCLRIFCLMMSCPRHKR